MSRSKKLLHDVWEHPSTSIGVYKSTEARTPLRRYLDSAISPATPLYRSVRLEMEGTFKLKDWVPFRATQVIRIGYGNIWSAKMMMGLIPISGHDCLLADRAELTWRACGLVKVMHQEGQDVRRSGAGRMAAELIWLPTSLCDAGVREEESGYTVSIFGHPQTVALEFNDENLPVSTRMLRWGSPTGRPFGQYPFGGSLSDWRTFQGIKIPCRAEIGWDVGTPDFEARGMFFKCKIVAASFR